MPNPPLPLDRGRKAVTVIRMVVGAPAASEWHYVMPPTLDYLPPGASDGTLPAIAMILGVISGPVAFAAVALAERRPSFYVTFDILSPTTYFILCGVLGTSLVLAILTWFGFAVTRKGRLLAGIAIAASLVWAAAFVAFMFFAISTLE